MTSVIFSKNWQGPPISYHQLLSLMDASNQVLQQGRNTVKLIELDNQLIVVKAFRVPSFPQNLIYRFFRKSKARRSFENAEKLLSYDINTPTPIAYCENRSIATFADSYYLCAYHKHSYSLADVLDNDTTPSTSLLEAFTEFTFKLHENKILHHDHNASNTLINEEKQTFSFSIIDINRISYKMPALNERLKNFTRLPGNRTALTIIAKHYAKLYRKDEQTCINLLLREKDRQEAGVRRKDALKREMGRR